MHYGTTLHDSQTYVNRFDHRIGAMTKLHVGSDRRSENAIEIGYIRVSGRLGKLEGVERYYRGEDGAIRCEITESGEHALVRWSATWNPAACVWEEIMADEMLAHGRAAS